MATAAQHRAEIDRINTEVAAQAAKIAQLSTILDGKAAGGGSGGGSNNGLPDGYTRADYIQFTGDQIVDTGVTLSYDGMGSTRIKVLFTRDDNTAQYMYGVANPGNTASVTAYLSSSGAWRFGDRSAARTIEANPEIIRTAIVDQTGIVHEGGTQAFSTVREFTTIGSLILGGARYADGSIGTPQFTGKILTFEIWMIGALEIKLIPLVNADSVYRFWDVASESFFDSLGDVPFEGGYF